MTDRIDEMSKRLSDEQARNRARAQALQTQAEITSASLPRVLGTKNDYSDPKNLGVIFKRVTGDGAIFYTRQGLRDPSLSPDQIRSLANTIKDEKASFETLSESDRDKIRSEFETSGNTPDNSYGNFLKSELLGLKFEQPR